MAVKTLALVYHPNGRVTHSGLTSNTLPAYIAKILTNLGIDFQSNSNEGRIISKTNFGATKQAAIIAEFNKHFDHPVNPYGSIATSTAVINESGTYAAGDTTLTVDDGTQFSAFDYIKIGSEVLWITAVNTHELTVVRGIGDTVDAAHADGSTIYDLDTVALTIASV